MTVLHTSNKPKYSLKSMRLKSKDTLHKLLIQLADDLNANEYKVLETKLNSENEFVAHQAAKEFLRYLKKMCRAQQS